MKHVNLGVGAFIISYGMMRILFGPGANDTFFFGLCVYLLSYYTARETTRWWRGRP